jgi:hypothetical protein
MKYDAKQTRVLETGEQIKQLDKDWTNRWNAWIDVGHFSAINDVAVLQIVSKRQCVDCLSISRSFEYTKSLLLSLLGDARDGGVYNLIDLIAQYMKDTVLEGEGLRCPFTAADPEDQKHTPSLTKKKFRRTPEILSITVWRGLGGRTREHYNHVNVLNNLDISHWVDSGAGLPSEDAFRTFYLSHEHST